ncbi:MAG: RNA polymerase sigma factor [Armatimonadota bacterium]|nr:MAG: RNA polymerase sigma factor [Armatimonadota bacterium]
MNLPVQILVERARRGERDAFEALFRETHVRIYNLFRALGFSRDEAADLTQETFVKAWQNLDGLREPEKFLSWLFRIARNQAKDLLKYRSRHPRVDLEELGALADPEQDLPLKAVESEELEREVRRAVASLPESQRAPLILYHFQNMPVAEIASALGVPFGTVLSRLARARAALARRLAPRIGSGSPGGD